MKIKNIVILICAILIIVCFFIWKNTIQNNSVYDDDTYFTSTDGIRIKKHLTVSKKQQPAAQPQQIPVNETKTEVPVDLKEKQALLDLLAEKQKLLEQKDKQLWQKEVLLKNKEEEMSRKEEDLKQYEEKLKNALK